MKILSMSLLVAILATGSAVFADEPVGGNPAPQSSISGAAQKVPSKEARKRMKRNHRKSSKKTEAVVPAGAPSGK